MGLRWRSHALEAMDDNRNWYAVYTKPRWEKKVHRVLSERGFESYCPLNKVRRQWSDRIKVVEEPLFKSYVFVRLASHENPGVRLVEGVLNFVYWNGRPAVVREDEIDTIRRFLHEYTDVRTERRDVKPADRVQILQGVLMDHTATVKRVFGNRVEVLIDSMGYALVAFVDKANLQAVPY
jgi:transcription antitermination factor NusG